MLQIVFCYFSFTFKVVIFLIMNQPFQMERLTCNNMHTRCDWLQNTEAQITTQSECNFIFCQLHFTPTCHTYFKIVQKRDGQMGQDH